MEKRNERQVINNINNNKETALFDELSATEGDLLKLGDSITELLNIIKMQLEGGYKNSDYKNGKNFECKEKLKEILGLVEKIRMNLHELVDKSYSQKNYAYLAKLSADLKEKEAHLNKITKIFEDDLPYKENMDKIPDYQYNNYKTKIK